LISLGFGVWRSLAVSPKVISIITYKKAKSLIRGEDAPKNAKLQTPNAKRHES